MLGKLHHIAIICSDYRRSMEFYVEKLGFSVVRDVEREERRDRLTLLQKGQIQLELFTKADAPARLTRPEALGLRHLAFRVEDAARTAAWLNSLGIETEPLRRDAVNGGCFTFFRDPDGLPLEIHE